MANSELPIIAAIAFTSGLTRGFVNERSRVQQQEQGLLLNTINSAVQNGQPEALTLLNPERLAAHGLDQFMPTYLQLATQVGKQKQIQLRQLEAQTRFAETQERVATATEQATIAQAGATARTAEAKAQGAELDLSNLQTRQQFIEANPELLMLPEQAQQMQIQNMASQIQERAAATKIAWAQLGETARHHKVIESKATAGAALEKMTLDAISALPEEERQNVLMQRFAPGVESNLQKQLTMFNTRLDQSQKTWQAVAKSINDTAAKAGHEPLEYPSQEAADADVQRLNAAAFQHNSYAQTLNSKYGQSVPELPIFEAVPIPGTIYGNKGWRLVMREQPLDEVINQLIGSGLMQPGAKAPTKTERSEQKPAEAKPPQVEESEFGRLTPGGTEFMRKQKERLQKQSEERKTKEVK